MKLYTKLYKESITTENLLQAWQEFLRGKSKRNDVILFNARLMDNIHKLHNDLLHRRYSHGGYQAFNISDPKPRSIHKAIVRDRLLHHLVYSELYPYFEQKFIFDSYSCRFDKGTHKAVKRFNQFSRIVSKNHTRTCWVLKCDIRKFFASIDHDILKAILKKHIADEGMLWLLSQTIDSFHTDGKVGVGLPLGNLTSQLLVNVYMNEFDHFAKRQLKLKHYIRYADDFVIMSEDKEMLEKLIPVISNFLILNLKLELHPNKVFIKTFVSGVDFLGWVHFSDHKVLRTSTKKRMIKNLEENQKPEAIASYKGMLAHGNGYKLQKQVLGSLNKTT